MLAHAFERIGAMEQRLNSIEVFLTTGQPVQQPVESEYTEELVEDNTGGPVAPHRFAYPIKAVPDTDNVPDITELRKIRYAQYKVTIMQPFADPPQKVVVDMTRDELDDYIKNNPGESFGEWIIGIEMEAV